MNVLLLINISIGLLTLSQGILLYFFLCVAPAFTAKSPTEVAQRAVHAQDHNRADADQSGDTNAEDNGHSVPLHASISPYTSSVPHTPVPEGPAYIPKDCFSASSLERAPPGVLA